jgi:hypothetical protein
MPWILRYTMGWLIKNTVVEISYLNLLSIHYIYRTPRKTMIFLQREDF